MRGAGVFFLGVALGSLALLLGSVAGQDVPVLVENLGGARPPAPDAVVLVVAELVGTLVAGWLAFGFCASAVAFLAGVRIRIPLLPSMIRRLIAGMLGASVVLGAAGPAMAASSLDPGWAPSTAAATKAASPSTGTPSRPVTTAPSTTSPTTTAPLTTAHSPTPTSSTVVKPEDEAGPVVVQAGDTLWDIASRELPASATSADVAREWPRWHAANRALIGADPDVIQPGMRLNPPTDR